MTDTDDATSDISREIAAFDTQGEFAFLPAQAAELGVSAPPVARVTGAAPDGRVVSALHWGAAPPRVSFLHGAGLNAHTWDRTVLALHEPALAVDLPGHGDSAWRDDAAYAGRALAGDILPLLHSLADRPQVLVGQSLGGLTAAAVAATAPELVAALVIVDISPGLDPRGGADQIRQFYAGPTDWAHHGELVDRALSFGLGGDRTAATRGVLLNSRVRPDGRVEWKHHFARIANALAADPRAAAAADAQGDALATVLAASGWDDLAAVTAPVTLVRGERGFLSPADVAEFARRVPHAEIVTLDSGHNVQEERAGELAEIVRRVAGNNPPS